MAVTGELAAYTLGPAPRFCPSGLLVNASGLWIGWTAIREGSQHPSLSLYATKAVTGELPAYTLGPGPSSARSVSSANGSGLPYWRSQKSQQGSQHPNLGTLLR